MLLVRVEAPLPMAKVETLVFIESQLSSFTSCASQMDVFDHI